ncbi:hypothetical protein EAKF1_ch4361 [Escherichia albertii KF1]|nr:hypothetical protein EAKF1_ch4361 [Escherichia albertii KF1]
MRKYFITVRMSFAGLLKQYTEVVSFWVHGIKFIFPGILHVILRVLLFLRAFLSEHD